MTSGSGEDRAPTSAAVALDRRAPFASNGQVGGKALETQQRILEAARRIFDDTGYEAATLEDIATRAGRSRVAVYQYFADKDDVFRALTAQLARELWSSLEELGPVTPDASGWRALRRWLGQQGDLHQEHRAVFREFAAATSDDEAFMREAIRTRDRQVALYESRVTASVVPEEHRTAAIRVLLAGSSRALELAAVIRTALPAHYGRDRVEDALADVVHRSLFGLQLDVNVRPTPAEPTPRLEVGSALADILDRSAALEAEAASPRRRALAALLAVGDDVIARRGRRGTRVEDVVEAAGVSRGAFYRYFETGDEYVHVIAARALRTASSAFGDVPGPSDAAADIRRAGLRRWLHSVTDVHDARRTLLHARAAGKTGRTLEVTTPGSFDWGRRRMSRALRGRAFEGDIDVEALVLLGMVEAFGAQARSPVEIEAMIDIIESGFLGSR